MNIARYSYGEQSGSSKSQERWNKSYHRSKNESLSFVDKSLLDSQFVRGLEANQAIALLSMHGYSMDDVLEMEPIFIDS